MRIAKWKSYLALAGLFAVSGHAATGSPQSALAPVLADLPQMQNARLETRAVDAPLDKTLQSLISHAGQPQWLAYGVPAVAGERHVCCGNYSNSDRSCSPCHLEGEHFKGTTLSSEKAGTLKLESPGRLIVLYRLEAQHLVRIRLASEECTLDFGGLPLLWLTGVQPAESVEFLTGFVVGQDVDRHDLAQGALSAIALHADASAERALESFIAPQQTESLRKQTAFWLGEARGKFGFAILKQMAQFDPSTEVRAQVSFALSVCQEPAAIDEMIRMAHDDTDGQVRGQALFWLAQKAGKKAVAALDGAIANDPDTEVKKKAVFALSQLPKDEGVPKLIQVAQTNRNPEVRQQAMFWLGQSQDPRALEFFEKVLSQ